MDKYLNSEVNQHILKLIFLGANVQVVSGKMIYVKFTLTDTLEVAYVYHINKKNKYFLERIKPYPLPISEFNTAEDVINTIKTDYLQYKNAVNSTNINNFVSVNRTLHKTIKSFEDLFLYYNIPVEYITKIENNINEIKETIELATNESNRILVDEELEDN